MSVANVRSFAVFALIALLAGCAGSIAGSTWPAQFVGRSAGEVIAAYGPDYRCTALDAARKRLTWHYSAQGVERGRDEPATPAVTPEGIGVMAGRQGLPRPIRVDCRLSFDLDAQHKVTSWRVGGDGSAVSRAGAIPLSVSNSNPPAPVAGTETCLAAVATLGRRGEPRSARAAQPAVMDCTVAAPAGRDQPTSQVAPQ